MSQAPLPSKMAPSFSPGSEGPTVEEYQKLLQLLMAQEKHKNELAARVAEVQAELERSKQESKLLKKHLLKAQSAAQTQDASMVPQSPERVPEPSKVLPKVVVATSDSSPSRERSSHRSASPSASPVSQSPVTTRSQQSRTSNAPSRQRSTSASQPPVSARDSVFAERYMVGWKERLNVGSSNDLASQSHVKVSLSTFYKVKSKGSGTTRLMKALRKESVVYPKLLHQQMNDVHLLEHPNLLRLLDAFEDTQQVYQVFDLLAGPMLLERVQSDPFFCERDAAAASKCLLQAVGYLHSRNMVYQNAQLEHLRFGSQSSQPRRRGAGSPYSEQLKLLDCSLCLHVRQLQALLQDPAAEPVPLLPVLGIGSVIGEEHIPPELKGFRPADGYMALAKTLEIDMPPKKVTARSDASPATSPTRISVTLEPGAKQAREVFRVLKASDMWVTGCAAHLLLTGELPQLTGQPSSPERAPELLQVPNMPDITSSTAQEACSSLLKFDPSERFTAEKMLELEWFKLLDVPRSARATGSEKAAARSAAAVSNGQTPFPDAFRIRLRRYQLAGSLRKLMITVQAIRAAADAAAGPVTYLPGPDHSFEADAATVASDPRSVAEVLCNETFTSILQCARRLEPTAAANGQLPVHFLTEALEVVAGDLLVTRPFRLTEPNEQISPTAFTELVWHSCSS